MTDPTDLELRAKVLGVLLRDARRAAGKSAKDCAALLGCTSGAFGRYETGQMAISLPELELLAYFFDVPLSHFWGQETLSDGRAQELEQDSAELLALRHRIVGAQLRAARAKAGLSMKELAAAAGLPASRLTAYEFGRKPIPIPELEALAGALDLAVEDFLPEAGPVAEWAAGRRDFQRFTELPPEVREFVADPMNESYLRLAMQLSSLTVERLRGIAAGILDITY